MLIFTLIVTVILTLTLVTTCDLKLYPIYIQFRFQYSLYTSRIQMYWRIKYIIFNTASSRLHGSKNLKNELQGKECFISACTSEDKGIYELYIVKCFVSIQLPLKKLVFLGSKYNEIWKLLVGTFFISSLSHSTFWRELSHF